MKSQAVGGEHHEQGCALGLAFGLALLTLPAAAKATPFTWTGFNLGGNAGVGFGGDTALTDRDGFNYYRNNFFRDEVAKVGDDKLFTGGGQIGYNHAFDRLVVGIETDFSSFDVYARKTPATSAADWGSDTYVALDMNWLATVRGAFGRGHGSLAALRHRRHRLFRRRNSQSRFLQYRAALRQRPDRRQRRY